MTAAALSGLLAVFTLALGPQTAMASPPTPVTIAYTGTETGMDGTFTADGILNTSGDATMVSVLDGNSMTLHCNLTLTDNYGTITLHLRCRVVLTDVSETGFAGGGPGQWAIVSGTGKYANLHGTGSLSMEFAYYPLLGIDASEETLEGSVFFDNRH